MKVDFLIIGAQKCATTTLYSLLNDHPELEGSAEKEPRFWAITKDWETEIEEYHRLFKIQSGDVKHFEASTVYTFFPLRKLNIWDDVFNYNSEMKIIYLVRNPIDRIISSWMHTFEMGWENDDLERAIVSNRMYIDVSRYATQIVPWINRFGRDNVLILDFDELVSNPKETLNKVAEHLVIDPSRFSADVGVARNRSVEDRKVSAQFIRYTPIAQKFQQWTPGIVQKIVRPIWRGVAYRHDRKFTVKPSLSVQSQEMIIRMLSLEIDCLSGLIGKDLSHWKVIKTSN